MTAGEIMKKVGEVAAGERVTPYYRLWMTGASLIIMVLGGLSLWGINSFISNEDGKITATGEAVAQLTKTVDNHIKADIDERAATASRIATTEERLGRVEQNREDVNNQLQLITATRDKQLQGITDALNKLTEGFAEVRAEVSEVKGKLEYALPPRSAPEPNRPY